MNEEETEEEREVDPVAQRINEIAERIRRIRQPFKARRQQIVDSLLGSLERRAHERSRAYRYHNPSEESEESEVEKLKAQVESLKQQLNEMHKRPKPTVAIRGE